MLVEKTYLYTYVREWQQTSLDGRSFPRGPGTHLAGAELQPVSPVQPQGWRPGKVQARPASASPRLRSRRPPSRPRNSVPAAGPALPVVSGVFLDGVRGFFCPRSCICRSRHIFRKAPEKYFFTPRLWPFPQAGAFEASGFWVDFLPLGFENGTLVFEGEVRRKD